LSKKQNLLKCFAFIIGLTKKSIQMKKYLSLVAIVLIIACNHSAQTSTAKNDSVASAAEPKGAVAPVFKDPKVLAIYSAYLSLKDALVSTDTSTAKSVAKTLSTKLKNYLGCENTAIIAEKMANAKDITAQRKEFTGLSSDVIALFKNAEILSGSIYVQHCPMANNGDGGDWISNEKKIRNPYFGSEMMECGAVTSEIKAKSTPR
jgi:hypothetical protein